MYFPILKKQVLLKSTLMLQCTSGMENTLNRSRSYSWVLFSIFSVPRLLCSIHECSSGLHRLHWDNTLRLCSQPLFNRTRLKYLNSAITFSTASCPSLLKPVGGQWSWRFPPGHSRGRCSRWLSGSYRTGSMFRS